MHREFAREGMLDVGDTIGSSQHNAHVRVFNAVDGLSLSEFVIASVLGEGAVLSTGEIGCFLSHLTLWWSVVRTSLPYAVVIEDDAVLTANFHDKLRYFVDQMTSTREPWDILLLEKCGEMRAQGEDRDCRAPAYDRMRAEAREREDGTLLPSLLRVDGIGCVPSGIRAYVVSQAGAKKLASQAMPLHHAVDVHLAELIYQGDINAYCTLPSIVHMHRGSLRSSDMASVPVYHTKVDGEVGYTARYGGFPSCEDILCVLQYRKKEKAEL